MLSVGKVRLSRSPRGVGAFFVVRKSKQGHLRPIWHGGIISDHCARPPAPRRLGNPAAFVDILVRRGEALYLSKRDAASFFDVLRAPSMAQQWFCCPPVRAGELAVELGVPLAALEAYLCEDSLPGRLSARTAVHPASCSWPMGFSWSSAVAQDVTLGVLLSTGLPEDAVICDAEELPAQDAELAVVATDDCLFFHRDKGQARSRLAAFDEALERAGIPRAREKDIDLADHIVGLGCELSTNPPLAAPESSKLLHLLMAILGLDEVRVSSPRAVHSALGVSNWFCILSRPHFACFEESYGFVRREPAEEAIPVPQDVCNEFMLFAALAPLLSAGLDRQWLPLIAATDAAPEFGFGLSVCPCAVERVTALGRKAERRGDFVRLDRRGDEDDEAQRPRLGKPHLLGLAKSDFRDILSLRASEVEHPGVMELKGVLLALRWLLRSRSRFHKRILLLVDAKAALSAVAKGRTNAPSFRRTLGSINAHLLASDTLLRPLYVPSEDNPADAPSRGRRRRPTDRRVLKKPGFSKVRRRLHHFVEEEALIQELLRRNWPTPRAELKAAVARRRAGVSA